MMHVMMGGRLRLVEYPTDMLRRCSKIDQILVIGYFYNTSMMLQHLPKYFSLFQSIVDLLTKRLGNRVFGGSTMSNVCPWTIGDGLWYGVASMKGWQKTFRNGASCCMALHQLNSHDSNCG